MLSPMTFRIPIEHRKAIEGIARRERRDLSSVVNEMIAEALKMRRVRGVLFADEGNRREAKVAGTGLGVWEVIETYLSLGKEMDRFRSYYDWLSEFQLRAALSYYEAYPQEIDEAIRENQVAFEELAGSRTSPA